MGVSEKLGLHFGGEIGEVFGERSFNLDLQGWLGFEWSDIGEKDKNASWSYSLANGGCELMDTCFLLSHPRLFRHMSSGFPGGPQY